MDTKNFTRLTSPAGYELKIAFRQGLFMVVNTNFNPFNFLDFAEVNIVSVPGIQQMEAVHVYDDGTGFYIFRLKPHTDRSIMMESVMNEFQQYFLN
jgi:hypothetical protein